MIQFDAHIDLVLATCAISIGYLTPTLFRVKSGYFFILLNSLIIICSGFFLLQFMNPFVACFSFLFGVTTYMSAVSQFSYTSVEVDDETEERYRARQRPNYPPNYTVWTEQEREEELRRRREEVKNSQSDETGKKYQESKSLYEILGVKEGCTLNELKEARRVLVKHFHPDKLHHLPESRRLEAEEELKVILLAYDELLKKFKN